MRPAGTLADEQHEELENSSLMGLLGHLHSQTHLAAISYSSRFSPRMTCPIFLFGVELGAILAVAQQTRLPVVLAG